MSAVETGISPKVEKAMREDFRVFLYYMFQHLGLETTDIQNDIARWLQHGPDYAVIMAFRGIGKSWLTAFYVLWLLFCNPQVKILVVSASQTRAAQFTTFCLALIKEVPWLRWLYPRKDQRASSENFDVAPARPDQSPSVKAAGITGQIVGSRADVIVPDDVEVPTNSATQTMREKLRSAIKEFGAIIKPGGKIKYLGTPQNEESIYFELEGLGFSIRIWPSEYPDKERERLYAHRLAPFVANGLKRDKKPGDPTEPVRFDLADLAKRRIIWGRNGYALQFMLDSSLSDEDRYPLRLADLIVTGLDRERGPETIAYGRDERLMLKDIHILGFARDRFYKPASVSEAYAPYTSIVAFLDPSGRGLDEAALCISAGLNGRVFILKVKGWLEGFAEETLSEIAELCVEFRVKVLRIESNFGGGVFGATIRPYLDAAWAKFNKGKPPGQQGQTGVEEERAGNTQKELRIAEILGPATQQHRIIVDEAVFREDYESILRMDKVEEDKRRDYSLAHQFSHLTTEKDCLAHDDRLDCFAGAVNYWAASLGINPKQSAEAADRQRAQEELERMMAGAEQILIEQDLKKPPAKGGNRVNWRGNRAR